MPSADGGDPPSDDDEPVSTFHGDGKGEQSHVYGVIANAQTITDAAGILARIGGRFRLIRAALLTSVKLLGFTSPTTAFPASVLAEAARAARTHDTGYDILRASALAEASLAGESGVEAAFNLGDGFDSECAALIDGWTRWRSSSAFSP